MTDYDASDSRHVRLLRNQAKFEETAHDVFVNTIMGMANGRHYIHDLLTYCRIFDQPYSTDPYNTAFACGQLDVGQHVLRRIMRICPQQYVQMMEEANARDRTADARRERSDKDSDGRDSEPPAYVHPAFRDDSPATSDASDYNPVDRAEGSE